MEERKEAAGKALVLLITATALYPVADAALQGALQTTGLYNRPPGTGLLAGTGETDQSAPFVQRFGPFSLVDAATGYLSDQKEWASALASLITPAPMIERGLGILMNRDPRTGMEIVNPERSEAGKMSARAQYLMQSLYPFQMAAQSMRGNPAGAIGALGGIRFPSDKAERAQAVRKRIERRQAPRQDRRDPILQMFNE
jgi:hypothetical protein